MSWLFKTLTNVKYTSEARIDAFKRSKFKHPRWRWSDARSVDIRLMAHTERCETIEIVPLPTTTGRLYGWGSFFVFLRGATQKPGKRWFHRDPIECVYPAISMNETANVVVATPSSSTGWAWAPHSHHQEIPFNGGERERGCPQKFDIVWE